MSDWQFVVLLVSSDISDITKQTTIWKEGQGSNESYGTYVETGRHKIFFDSGQSDAFVKNAETLGIRLDDIDTAVLSHGHFDHSGGLKEFMEINQKAEIYMQRGGIYFTL